MTSSWSLDYVISWCCAASNDGKSCVAVGSRHGCRSDCSNYSVQTSSVVVVCFVVVVRCSRVLHRRRTSGEQFRLQPCHRARLRPSLRSSGRRPSALQFPDDADPLRPQLLRYRRAQRRDTHDGADWSWTAVSRRSRWLCRPVRCRCQTNGILRDRKGRPI